MNQRFTLLEIVLCIAVALAWLLLIVGVWKGVTAAEDGENVYLPVVVDPQPSATVPPFWCTVEPYTPTYTPGPTKTPVSIPSITPTNTVAPTRTPISIPITP